MIWEHSFNSALVKIWDSPNDAPRHIHSLRDTLKLDVRKKEWDRVEQCLLPQYTHDDVIKNDWGQPSLKDGKFISISHSGNYAAVGTSRFPIGIDIQIPHDSVFNIRNKFCHKEELLFLQEDAADNRYLKLWCAKEAIFKIYGHRVDFSNDLRSEPFQQKDLEVVFHQQGAYHKKEELLVQFVQNPSYFVAIAQKLKE
jgi:phosphopantetheinyl transferase